MSRALPLLLVVLAGLGVVAGCARDNQLVDGGTLSFEIGGIPLRVSSGAARAEGNVLALYLTDQPDGCLAVTQVPVGMATIFVLRVAPMLDGTRAAMVAPTVVVPGPGQASGKVVAQTGGVQTAGYDASSGTVSWKENEDGTTTILALDVGFAGADGRIVATELTVPACP